MNWDKSKLDIIILLAITLLIRVSILILVEPIETDDSSGYIDYARNLSPLNEAYFDGGRTPIYPLFIMLFGSNLMLVTIGQHVLGILMTFTFYKISISVTRNRSISFWFSLFYSIYAPFLYFEHVIATETLTSFLILSALFFALPKENQKTWHILAAIFLASLAGITRPLYLYFPFLLFAFFLFHSIRIRTYKFGGILSLVFSLFIILSINHAWMRINERLSGQKTITTYSGISIINKVGTWMEDAPDSKKSIKETYIHHRKLQVEREGYDHNTIWRAFEDMKTATGMSSPELCNEIKAISIDLIKQHPKEYFLKIPPSWIRFWKPIGLGDNVPKNLKLISVGQRLIFLLLTIFVLIYPVFFLFVAKIRKSWDNLDSISYVALLYLVFLGASILQALVEFGYARYSVPTDALILLVAVVALNTHLPKKLVISRFL